MQFSLVYQWLDVQRITVGAINLGKHFQTDVSSPSEVLPRFNTSFRFLPLASKILNMSDTWSKYSVVCKNKPPEDRCNGYLQSKWTLLFFAEFNILFIKAIHNAERKNQAIFRKLLAAPLPGQRVGKSGLYGFCGTQLFFFIFSAKFFCFSATLVKHQWWI